MKAIVEPHLKTAEGLRKPDLVTVRGKKAITIDVQIIGDTRNPFLAHEEKISYYRHNPEVSRGVMCLTSCKEVQFSTLTINWRGVWSGGSVKELLDLGVIKRKQIKIVSMRVLLGSVFIYRKFMATTTRTRCG